MEVANTDFRANYKKYTDLARDGETIFITKHGRPDCVLVSYEKYEELVNAKHIIMELQRELNL